MMEKIKSLVCAKIHEFITVKIYQYNFTCSLWRQHVDRMTNCLRCIIYFLSFCHLIAFASTSAFIMYLELLFSYSIEHAQTQNTSSCTSCALLHWTHNVLILKIASDNVLVDVTYIFYHLQAIRMKTYQAGRTDMINEASFLLSSRVLKQIYQH